MKKILIGILVAGVVAGMNSWFVVQQTEQALVVRFGKVNRVVQEAGLYIKTPFVDEVRYFDNRLLDFDAPPKEVIARGSKPIVIDAFLRYRINDPLKFYQNVRNERIIRDRLNTNVEASLLQVIEGVYLEDLLSDKREEIMQQIQDVVTKRTAGTGGKKLGIEIVDVRIKRTDLPKANSQAIYKRMQTEREREAKEFRAKGAEEAQKIRSRADKDRTILIAEAKKESEILRGEGDAKAVKIFADAFGRDKEFFEFYRSMQVYKNVLKKGDTKLILSPDTEFLKYLK